MTTKITVAELLRWRSVQAERDAPPAPRAARLLEIARPWWERYPDKFRVLARQLGAVQMGYGHAMVDVGAVVNVPPVVPALMITGEEINETCIRPLYFDVTDGLLRMRFELDFMPSRHEALEVTFVAENDLQALLTVHARSSIANEYWLEAALPENMARECAALKVTSRMPFRLLIRPQNGND